MIDFMVMAPLLVNPKSQAPNSKQIPNYKSQIPNNSGSHFMILVIGHCDFLVICNLLFVISFIINLDS